MTKKKIITLALVAVIAVTAIASASIAYFTDTKTAKNTFTMGKEQLVVAVYTKRQRIAEYHDRCGRCRSAVCQ